MDALTLFIVLTILYPDGDGTITVSRQPDATIEQCIAAQAKNFAGPIEKSEARDGTQFEPGTKIVLAAWCEKSEGAGA